MAAPRTSLLLRLLLLRLLLLSLSQYQASAWSLNRSFGDRRLAAIEVPSHPSYDAAIATTEISGCGRSSRAAESDRAGEAVEILPMGPMKIHMRHLSEVAAGDRKPLADLVVDSALRDLHRIQTLHRRITEKKKKKQKKKSRIATEDRPGGVIQEQILRSELAGRLTATLESGLSLGSGEYLADVFVGTPPRHFWVILDTGSDLNWLQCVPCHDCFEQRGPFYDPSLSSSHAPVPCADARCALVSSPEPTVPCRNATQGCPYFYWYGDRSNTTGDLAVETFTVNLTASSAGIAGPAEMRQHRVDGVIFGCGHWNRGLFHGAAGLLGLGRGPLSFSSQLRPLYGGVFSYCLVDRNSDLSVTSKLVFGEDRRLMARPDLNFTAFAAGKEDPADTFYYVGIKAVKVGGRLVDIPPKTWELGADGGGGTIVDSGTTLSYFAEPAYSGIREAFLSQVSKGNGYPVVEGIPVLSPCFNVSGAGEVELPEFGIVFGDGAEWNLPRENYFIMLEKGDVACLAMLGTPSSSLSILGNYLQQNFHVVYDTDRSRLGFAPARCADL